MVLKKNKSNARVASTAVATFGAAMASMYLTPEMQADVVDLTWNGGNAMATAPFSSGTLNVVPQNIDQVMNSFGNPNFIQFNDQYGGTGRTFDPFGSTFLGGMVSGLVTVTLASQSQVLDPANFTGATSGAVGGSEFDGTGSTFIAFRDGAGNVGWFQLNFTTDGDIFYGPGQYGSMGEMLTVGGGADCRFELGDVNGDGMVSLLDVGPFVDLILTNGFECQADINGDGSVDLLDVGDFVDIFTGG